MFECPYCASVFEHVTETGSCPACGAPKPKRLQPEVQVVVVDRYLYVESRDYYAPPQPTVTQRAYSSLGYKIVSTLSIATLIVVVVALVYFWNFYQVNVPNDSDPSLQYTVPTSVSTPTAYTTINLWTQTKWLSSDEALSLREKSQVVNLAYLDRGQAKYADGSLVLNESWEQFKPLSVTSLDLHGSSIELTVNGDKYFLNIYQPFVIHGQPEYVYLVDQNSQIWRLNSNHVTLTNLDTVHNSLSVDIAPNPKLSPTY